jgi:prepilin signal peptidase PulO-like enzyme (type II secretory pathway)
VASLSAAIVGVGLMVFRRTGRATTVAFGPFLAVGTVAAIVLGSSPHPV